MAIELATRDRVTVLSLQRGLNQAAVLTAREERKVDDPAVLAVGTEVQYTDPDLGLVFFGRIVAIRKSFSDGEGVTYECADPYRTLAKQPALLGNSTRIRIFEGRDSDLLAANILNGLPSGTLPGGFDTTALSGYAMTKQDKAGQSVDTWLDAIMKLTGDIVAWVEPNAGSPKLWFREYESQPDLTLQIGDYEVVQPVKDGDPLLVDAQLGQALDKKYRGVRVEGCGTWERFVDKFIEGTLISGDASTMTYEYRFILPEEFATGRYMLDAETCQEYTEAKFLIGYSGANPISYHIPGLPISYDDATGEYFFPLLLRRMGIFFDYPPPVPIVSGYFTYTGWTGPSAIEVVSSDPNLAGEGLFVMQRNDMVVYVSADYSRNDAPKMTALAAELYDRHSGAADAFGSAAVHIKGLNPDVVLGARLTNAQFNSARIRSIRYDFTGRNMDLECSDLPVREAVENAKKRSQLNTEDGDNWWANHEREESCMCLKAMYVDENGTGSQGDDGDDGGGFDCIQGQCVPHAGPFATAGYATFNECDRFCEEKSWDFVPCAGCLPSEDQGFGQYADLAACQNDHPEGPFAPEYDCGGFSGTHSLGDGQIGGGADWDCPNGVKRITTDRNGAISNVECLP